MYCYEVILCKTSKNFFCTNNILSPSLSDFSHQCSLDKEWHFILYINLKTFFAVYTFFFRDSSSISILVN